jgi:hypothetical protein
MVLTSPREVCLTSCSTRGLFSSTLVGLKPSRSPYAVALEKQAPVRGEIQDSFFASARPGHSLWMTRHLMGRNQQNIRTEDGTRLTFYPSLDRYMST